MTIILVAAGFFALALVVVFLFRSAVRADDELDRRWEEVVRPTLRTRRSAVRARGRRAAREPQPRSAGRPAIDG